MLAERRRIELQGPQNFRDLGGYETTGGARVRVGVLFRSDALHRLSPGDARRLRELGLLRVFDLRTRDELDRHGVGLVAEHFEHHHVPFVERIDRSGAQAALADEDGESFDARRAARYLDMLDRAHPTVRAVVRALAGGDSAGGASVFHCTAGKDRTGVLAALILRVLGVDDAQIAADYALTTRYLHWSDADLERMSREYNFPIDRRQLEAKPETMHLLLAGLDARFGSAEAYLYAAGVEEHDLHGLRARLLDSA